MRPPAAPPPTSASPRQQAGRLRSCSCQKLRSPPSSLPSFSPHTSESSRAYLQTTPETVPLINAPQSRQHHQPVTKKPPLAGFPPPRPPLNSQTSALWMTILSVLYQMFLETLSQLLTHRAEVWGVTLPAARARSAAVTHPWCHSCGFCGKKGRRPSTYTSQLKPMALTETRAAVCSQNPHNNHLPASPPRVLPANLNV